jgi:AbiU2
MAAPPNSVDRQILDLRDLFTQLEQRYVALVANFQMLRPLLDNDLLKERMDDPSKRLGAVAIATALFNACVLDACALLRMPRPKERLKIGQYPNMALADAIKPFLPKNRTKNGTLIDQLSKERLNRAAHSPSQYSKTMPPDVVQRFIEDDDRKRDASLCEFQDDLEALLKDYCKLPKLHKTLANPRNKWIAHLDVRRDSATQSLVVPDMADFKDQFAALESAFAVIGRLMSHLVSIINGAETAPEDVNSWVQEQVVTFWDLSLSEAADSQRPNTMTPESSDPPSSTPPPGHVRDDVKSR